MKVRGFCLRAEKCAAFKYSLTLSCHQAQAHCCLNAKETSYYLNMTTCTNSH